MDPDGGVTTFAYDSAARLTSLLNPFAERTTWAYDAAGQVTTMTLGNATETTFTFDDAGQVTGIHAHTSGASLIQSFAYAYSDSGVRTGVLEGSGDRVTWSYDANWRLTREQRDGSNAYDITYAYDPVGSRLTKLTGGTTTTYAYNAGDALTLEEVAGTLTTYAYDAEGNTTVVNASGALTTMTWDGENRLSVIALPGGVVTSVYDATGLRRQREDASGVTKYLWDGVNLLAETNSGGTTQARYTAALGQYGPVLSQRRSGTSAFYHAGALGTINRLTDASQNVTDLYALDAWGRSVASSGSTTNPHRYVGALGYYTEPDLGMDYVRARWLRPSTGSWVSVDPIEGQPRYGYVGGRATGAVDPEGLGGLGRLLRQGRGARMAEDMWRDANVGRRLERSTGPLPPRPRRGRPRVPEFGTGEDIDLKEIRRIEAQGQRREGIRGQGDLRDQKRRLEEVREYTGVPPRTPPELQAPDHPGPSYHVIGPLIGAPGIGNGGGAGGGGGVGVFTSCADLYPDPTSDRRIMCEGCVAVIQGLDVGLAIERLYMVACVDATATVFLEDLAAAKETCMAEGRQGGDCIDCCGRTLADDNDRTRCEQACFGAGLG